jgi:hypothetical protein
MEGSNQLANRVRAVFMDGKWIANTNYKHQLSEVNCKQATTKIQSLNTLAALTYHINYYLDGILNVFNGGSLEIRDKYSFDLPDIDSEEAWQSLKNELWKNAEKVATHVEKLSDEQLEDVFVNEKYGSYRRNIEGVIEHSYYHLGQISLLGKLINTHKQESNSTKHS